MGILSSIFVCLRAQSDPDTTASHGAAGREDSYSGAQKRARAGEELLGLPPQHSVNKAEGDKPTRPCGLGVPPPSFITSGALVFGDSGRRSRLQGFRASSREQALAKEQEAERIHLKKLVGDLETRLADERGIFRALLEEERSNSSLLQDEVARLGQQLGHRRVPRSMHTSQGALLNRWHLGGFGAASSATRGEKAFTKPASEISEAHHESHMMTTLSRSSNSNRGIVAPFNSSSTNNPSSSSPKVDKEAKQHQSSDTNKNTGMAVAGATSNSGTGVMHRIDREAKPGRQSPGKARAPGGSLPATLDLATANRLAPASPNRAEPPTPLTTVVTPSSVRPTPASAGGSFRRAGSLRIQEGEASEDSESTEDGVNRAADPQLAGELPLLSPAGPASSLVPWSQAQQGFDRTEGEASGTRDDGAVRSAGALTRLPLPGSGTTRGTQHTPGPPLVAVSKSRTNVGGKTSTQNAPPQRMSHDTPSNKTDPSLPTFSSTNVVAEGVLGMQTPKMGGIGRGRHSDVSNGGNTFPKENGQGGLETQDGLNWIGADDKAGCELLVPVPTPPEKRDTAASAVAPGSAFTPAGVGVSKGSLKHGSGTTPGSISPGSGIPKTGSTHGVPNSNAKYHEDNPVVFRSTPFEKRLEEKLAKENAKRDAKSGAGRLMTRDDSVAVVDEDSPCV